MMDNDGLKTFKMGIIAESRGDDLNGVNEGVDWCCLLMLRISSVFVIAVSDTLSG